MKFFPEYLRKGWYREYQPVEQYLVTNIYNTIKEIGCYQFPVIMQNNFNKQNKLIAFQKFKLETIKQSKKISTILKKK